MGAWLDFMLLVLALLSGWLGWVLLTLAGYRPFAALSPRYRPATLTRRAGQVVKTQAADSDR